MSAAEETLAVQLDQAGIGFEREFRFANPRRWRADFVIYARPIWDQSRNAWLPNRILVEIDGGAWTQGRHVRGKGFERDLEKLNAAALLGYRVLRFTPAMVDDGRAFDAIRQAIEDGVLAA